MIVAGIGGNLKDAVVDMLHVYDKANLLLFTDLSDDVNASFYEKRGLQVIAGKEELYKLAPLEVQQFICLIGDNYKREKKIAELSQWGLSKTNYTSKFAMVNTEFASVSEKCSVIMHFANVSADSSIGDGTIVYAYTAIAHNVNVGNYVFISAHCAISNSTIGDYTFVGLNSMIGPGVRVGKHCVVGANSYVKADLPDGAIAVGSPARIIGFKEGFGK